MRHIVHSLRMLAFMTVLTGIAYPLVVTGIGQVVFNERANGSLIRAGDRIHGSLLVAQNFEGPKYFWPRPSAVGFNPLPSGGSNLSPISADLKKVVEERRAKLKAAHADQGEPPPDLLFASGSGLDPEISPEAAAYQLSRVAAARGMEPDQLKQIVNKFTSGRQLGVFGQKRVHVLALNVALDQTPPGGTQ